MLSSLTCSVRGARVGGGVGVGGGDCWVVECSFHIIRQLYWYYSVTMSGEFLLLHAGDQH